MLDLAEQTPITLRELASHKLGINVLPQCESFIS
jgi:hypothetical protein